MKDLCYKMEGKSNFIRGAYSLSGTGTVECLVEISGVATGGDWGGRVPPLVPRTDCGIRPDPMRS